MKRFLSLTALLVLGVSASLDVRAQTLPSRAPAQAAAPVAAPVVAEPAQIIDVAFPEKQWRREIVRVGSDFTLAVDDGARQVTMIGGHATIAGRVAGDVVVVLGTLDVAPTAFIDGSLIVIGSSATVADGARVRRDAVMVGGRLDAPASFAPGGDYTLIGPQVFNERLAGVFDWLARGLLWGRPIVPSLWWVWMVLAVFFLGYLVLGVMFEQPVREISETLDARPFTTLVVGFLITLIFGPVCVLLAVSVVGIAVIPLVLAGLVAAFVLGKIGTMRWIGRRVAGPGETPRADAFRSFVIGFVIVSIAYMVPALGLLTWTILSVFGLGGATLAFISAYRRESPVFPRAPRVAAVTVVPASVAQSAPFQASAFATPAVAMADGGEMPFDEMPPVPPASSVASVAAFGPGDLVTFPKASFRDRLAAGVLDLILLLILVGFFDNLLDDNRGFVFALIYFVGFWTWKQTTLGGIICQLRIVRLDNQPIRFADALVRGLSGIFSLAVLGLGFLWILRDADRQAWHDRIAGTYVVKVPRDWPL